VVVDDVNKANVNEDDLEDVMEIIKGDQIEDNNALKEISGISKESNGDQTMENMKRQTPNPRRGEKSKKEGKRKMKR
jgi:hypothetical protein